jgi:fructose-bisphosphate aldolase, class II
MLTTLSDILTRADLSGYAVVAPDFPSLFTARAILEEAEELHAPLILSYGTLFKPIREVSSYNRFIQIVREEADLVSVPVALHLDHAMTQEEIVEAVELGFTSVMIDASAESYEVNIERTLRAVQVAHPAGVSVEAELGHVATGADYLVSSHNQGFFTDPTLAAQFVEATGIDALAVAVGTVHGIYQGEPSLDYARLRTLDETIHIPLVLHGSSGLSDATLRKTIKLGIRKINVYSEIITRILNETRKCLAKEVHSPVQLGEAQAAGVKEVIRRYIQVTGSAGASTP